MVVKATAVLVDSRKLFWMAPPEAGAKDPPYKAVRVPARTRTRPSLNFTTTGLQGSLVESVVVTDQRSMVAS